MKSTTIVSMALVAVFAIAFADEKGTWETTKADALSSLDANDCTKAWQLIWPWARGGNSEARAILATAIYASGVMAPNSNSDALSLLRHSLILAVHGSTNGDSAAIELLHALLRTKLISDMGGKAVEDCLNRSAPTSKCVEDAVNDGLVPSFDDYAREVDALAAAGLTPKRSCRLDGDTNGISRRPSADAKRQ